MKVTLIARSEHVVLLIHETISEVNFAGYIAEGISFGMSFRA